MRSSPHPPLLKVSFQNHYKTLLSLILLSLIYLKIMSLSNPSLYHYCPPTHKPLRPHFGSTTVILIIRDLTGSLISFWQAISPTPWKGNWPHSRRMLAAMLGKRNSRLLVFRLRFIFRGDHRGKFPTGENFLVWPCLWSGFVLGPSCYLDSVTGCLRLLRPVSEQKCWNIRVSKHVSDLCAEFVFLKDFFCF